MDVCACRGTSGFCMTIPAYTRPRLRKESFLGCSLREAGEYVQSWQGQ